MKKVYVGLSGGVDSSVAALLLKQQGYDVTGVYMKNWTKDLPGMPCPWKEDFQDAKRIAVQLGIPSKVYDFEKQYFDKVVKYMLDGFKTGFTPNPDIMCNQEIKFKLLLETALQDRADMIATGHYAQIQNSEFRIQNSGPRLLMARDTNKDQTYFLHRVKKSALQKTLFPLGELTKPEVRAIAKKHGLVTADKKESMGICFVGKVGIKDFLRQYIKEKPGKIIDQKGQVIGQHDGAFFYTIGQRHGLEAGGGLPYYVTGKDMKKNYIYVTTNLDDKNLWSREVKLANLHWISGEPPISDLRSQISVRLRHRGKLIKAKKLNPPEADNSKLILELEDEVRALTPGQSAVFYRGEVCLGGGIVA